MVQAFDCWALLPPEDVPEMVVNGVDSERNRGAGRQET